LIGKFGELASEVSAVWFWNKLKLRGGSRGGTGNERLAHSKGGFSALAQAIADNAVNQGAVLLAGTPVTALEINEN
jgi:hypothetical protein